MDTQSKLQTPSEWLSELDSHSIYDSAAMKLDYTKCTGLAAPGWPEYTPRQTSQAIQARGLGGSMKRDAAGKQCYGWEVARTLERDFVPAEARRSHIVQGRGSAFRLCIEALKSVGK